MLKIKLYMGVSYTFLEMVEWFRGFWDLWVPTCRLRDKKNLLIGNMLYSKHHVSVKMDGKMVDPQVTMGFNTKMV